MSLHKSTQLKTVGLDEKSLKACHKADAMAMAKLAYDVFKEKKQREKLILINGQNNAKQPSSN